jgi:hypothetical protein
MSLLCRILKWLYLFVSITISSSLIDDPYGNWLLLGILNLLIVLFWLGSWGAILVLMVWVVSLELLMKTMLGAYLLAWIWEKFWRKFTPFGQEMYLVGSTVGYTILIGTIIQIHQMPQVDGNRLIWYWAILLAFGFIVWRITLHQTTLAKGFQPKSAIKKIEYQHHFCKTKMPDETPSSNPVQAYLKKLLPPERDSRS